MGSRSVKTHFVVHEVVVLSGFTKHMLDYLAREDIFRASGGTYGLRGRQRKYTFADVVLLRALHRICGSRGRIKNLKEALAALRGELGPLMPGQQLEGIVFVDGDELSVRMGKEAGRQLRTGQMTFGFVLDLGLLANELTNVVTFDRRSGAIGLVGAAAANAESVRQLHWQRIRQKRERAA